MFCSNDCRNEYDQRSQRYSEIPRGSALESMKRALDISGSYEELSRIYFNPANKTVFDYDFSNPNDETTKRNKLKCIASLKRTQFGDNSLSAQFVSTLAILSERLESLNIPSRNKEIIIEFRKQNLLITMFNSFTLSGSITTIPIFLPLVNHSCDPNIDIVNVENCFVAVVNRPLKAGDQIFTTT